MTLERWTLFRHASSISVDPSSQLSRREVRIEQFEFLFRARQTSGRSWSAPLMEGSHWRACPTKKNAFPSNRVALSDISPPAPPSMCNHLTARVQRGPGEHCQGKSPRQSRSEGNVVNQPPPECNIVNQHPSKGEPDRPAQASDALDTISALTYAFSPLLSSSFYSA